MPITYEIDTDARLVRTSSAGDVVVSEILDHLSVLLGDPRLPERPSVLLDLRENTSTPDSNQIRLVAEELVALREKLHWDACAIVVGRDVMFGMSRMFEVFARDAFREIQVFRDYDEAEAWLASRPGCG